MNGSGPVSPAVQFMAAMVTKKFDDILAFLFTETGFVPWRDRIVIYDVTRGGSGKNFPVDRAEAVGADQRFVVLDGHGSLFGAKIV